jgi:ornithine--oxo-acid transaminase
MTHTAHFDAYAKTINPQLVKVLRTIGFDRDYVRAEGAYLFDAEGTRFLDCLAGYGVFNMGRNHPTIKAALKAAIDQDLPSMIQMDAPALAAQLASALLLRVHNPHIDRVFFTNSGTEAVEAAVKFARCFTKRSGLLYCTNAFHGLTNGALSLNGNREFRDPFEPLLPGTTAVPFGDLTALADAVATEQFAAFIVEPIQGKGVYTAPPAYFDEAIRICRRHGTLVIADEIQTGLGRTGKWFAAHHWEEKPDMVCVAKALSGGFIPVGALCYPRAVYDAVYSSMDRCVIHSNTFGRNTLAMVAGLAALEVLEQDQLMANAAIQGKRLRDGLTTLCAPYEMVQSIRGEGLMIGLEFGQPQSLGLRTGWKLIEKVNKGLFGQLITVPLFTKHRILAQVAGHNAIVKLLPSLTLTDADVEWILTAFADVVGAAHQFPGAAWDVGRDLAKRAMQA